MWAPTLFCWLSLGLEISAFLSPSSPNPKLLERDVAADVCIPGPNGVATQPQVIVYPVTVQTSCPANTVISIGGCPTGITVTNAPTSINTCVTATTTVTVTSTQSASISPSPVPTGLSAEAQEIVRELNLLTAITRNAASQAADLNDATVEQIADSLDAITRQLDAFTPIVQAMSPITAENDLAAITEAFNNFVEAQAALLSTINQQVTEPTGANNGTSSAAQRVRRQSGRLSQQSSARLARALESLQAALDTYVTALSLILTAIAEAILNELALLNALFQAILDNLRGNAGASPSVTGTSPTSSLPSTIPTITFPSNTSSSVTSTQGPGSASSTQSPGSITSTQSPGSTTNSSVPATIMPTGTGVTSLPMSLNSSSTASPGLGTSAPTLS